MNKCLKTPFKKADLLGLRAGEMVLFSGKIYTARDQAHQKIIELIKKVPVDFKDQVIYYCGPAATPKGKVIGSCGPTTSQRMDEFTEVFLKHGLLAMIGKGRRSLKTKELIKKHKVVYFIAPAGCGALLAKLVKRKRLVCFKELGPEAIYQLEVKDFPLIVGIDTKGHDVYKHLV